MNPQSTARRRRRKLTRMTNTPDSQHAEVSRRRCDSDSLWRPLEVPRQDPVVRFRLMKQSQNLDIHRRSSAHRAMCLLTAVVLVAVACSDGGGDELTVPTTEAPTTIEQQPTTTTRAPATTNTFLDPVVGPGGAQEAPEGDVVVVPEPGQTTTTHAADGHTHDEEVVVPEITEITEEVEEFLAGLDPDEPIIPEGIPPATTAAPFEPNTTTPITAAPDETDTSTTTTAAPSDSSLPAGVSISSEGKVIVADPNLDGDNNPATGETQCFVQDNGHRGCHVYRYADDPQLPPRVGEPFVITPNPSDRILVSPGTDGAVASHPVELQIGSWRPSESYPGYEDIESYQIVVGFVPLPSLGSDVYDVLICSVNIYFGLVGSYVGTANGMTAHWYAVQDDDGNWRMATGWGTRQGDPC